MTSFIVFPDIDGDSVFPPEVRQAIADAPELEAKYAPISGSAQYLNQIEVLQLLAPKIDEVEVVALLASKLDAAQKGQASGVAALDSGTKLLESNIPDRLSEAAQNSTYALKTELPPNTLDGLTDVTAPSPSDGQALIWDSATSLWKNTTLVTSSSTINDLTDVTTTSPNNGQLLSWDSATSQWKNVTFSTTSLTTLAKTANYTLTSTDELVTFNGSSLTATIPDPTTVTAKILRIKNLHATALSVVSAGSGKTIDGAASLNVWQYQILTVISDGATWLIVGGRELTPSSTYKPFINDTTSGTGATFTVWTNVNSTEPALWARSDGVANRPALRATIFSGSPANIFEGGAWVGGFFTKLFNLDVGGKITKLSGVDFTISAVTANPQDAVSTDNGTVTDTGTKLTFQKRAAGTPWPAWHYQPFGYFGQPQTKTSSYTLEFKDTLLIGNGSSITFTLPDPTASGLTAGRKFEFKNIHATSLTIISAGTSKTIDGAASLSLAQWAKATVMTDGSQWLII